MRLLNVGTRKLQEFVVNVPKYAILSHTWGDDEVTFQDLGCPDHTKKRGYTKIEGLCCLAAKNGFEWVWIDTCCIDKTSSAELSEAINSMYRWYKDASICYAYLEDVLPEKCPAYVEDGKPHMDLDRDDDKWSTSEPYDHEYPEAFVNHFGSSRWFTRGWTLQELLAPKNLYFFNAAWKEFGTRSMLAHRIESITSIPVKFLRRHPYTDFRKAKVAVRMSWAARRQTTRVEDGAYSLFGIFDVNMPLLYGEGENAFKRLQLEILKESPDESMLAWRLPRELGSLVSLKSLNDRALKYSDSLKLLASSPQDFIGWFGAQIKPLFESGDRMMEMTNRGLRITLPLIKCRVDTYGVFNYMMDNTFDKVLAIRLLRTNVADEYYNAGLVTLSWQIAKKCQEKTIHCVRREWYSGVPRVGWDLTWTTQWIRVHPPQSIPERLVGVIPEHSYNKDYNRVDPWWWKSETMMERFERLGPAGLIRRRRRVLLHYKQDLVDDSQDHDSNGDGFVVIISPRSALSAFFSFELMPSPFACHTLPMPKGEKLEHFLSRDEYREIYETPPEDDHRNLSDLGSKFSLKSGVPRAWIQRENTLDCDHWVVSIHKAQSLAGYAGPIAKLIMKLRSLKLRPLKWSSRSVAEWLVWFSHYHWFYVDDLLLGLNPVVAWWLNSKRRRITRSWKEATACGGLAFLLYLLRYKAYLALLSQRQRRSSFQKLDGADFYHRVVYLPFALWFPISMYTLFPRSRMEAKFNPLFSVLCSMAAIILAKGGQKVSRSLGLKSLTEDFEM